MYLISWMIDLVVYWFYYIVKPQNICRPKIKVNNNDYPTPINTHVLNRKKPDWVVVKVIYLKAIMPSNGCGKIAATFNRLYFDKGESVSKTFVYEKLKANKYQLSITKRNIKSKPPYSIPVNRTWGVDLATVIYQLNSRLFWG